MNYYQKIVEISGHILSNSHEEEFKSGWLAEPNFSCFFLIIKIIN